MDDQYAGQGGSYILDPETGERTLVERTSEAAPTPPPEPQQSPQTDPL